MKFFLILFLAGGCGLAWAQTNSPAKAPKEQQIEITSDRGLFDQKTMQMTYQGHVVVTDKVKATLQCGQLTVNLPPAGGRPTNIVAKGQTNYVTADIATYAYGVLTNNAVIVTNETVTFTGGNPTPKVENPQVVITGEPLVLNLATKQFGGMHYKMILKQTPTSSKGTNASPFNFLK